MVLAIYFYLEIQIMLKLLRQFFQSFSMKLFIWFWLIALVAIFATRFISMQFSNDVISKAVFQKDLEPLRFISRTIDRVHPSSVEALFKKLKKKRRIPRIWLKNTITGALYSSFDNPQENPEQNSIYSYLKTKNVVAMASFIFPQQRLTGPKIVMINDQSYQLFVSFKHRPGHFKEAFYQVPVWLRFVIALVITFFLCLLLARSISKPILAIKKAALQLGEGDLGIRVQDLDHRHDEFGSLAKSFNQMADKLSNNVYAHQRLLGDVSHELRSPLTRLQMALGLAQQTPIEPDVQLKYLQRCELEVTRLDQMISDVLALSRLENTTQAVNHPLIDLSQLIQNIISDAQFIAGEQDINIEFLSPQKIMIYADNQLIASAISNIINNAIKYSKASGSIIVTMTQQAQQLFLHVEDNGCGVPEQTLAHLFEPFYRVHDARDRKTGGTGLGLAIAQQAVMAHKGEISAHNNNKGGLTVTIMLPI